MKVFFRTTSIKSGKHRPEWFSYESCFKNLLKEFPDECVTVFFDGDPTEHFVSKYDCKLVRTDAGSETQSFTNLIEYILNIDDLQDDEIIYIVEDDYLHKPGAMKILNEAFENIDTDYVTLYDSTDKYFPGYFERFAYGFKTSLIFTANAHWRTTPSTTNTFATCVKTLREDAEIHYKFSAQHLKITDDHKKFHALWEKGRMLVSSIPGYSTHVENMQMSPVCDWEALSKDSSLSKNESLSKDESLSSDASLDLPVDPTNYPVSDAC
jgi:hypothetical protein